MSIERDWTCVARQPVGLGRPTAFVHLLGGLEHEVVGHVVAFEAGIRG